MKANTESLVDAALQNEIGPAALAGAPDRGSIETLGDTEMNTSDNSTAPADGATETGELAVDRVNRLAFELSHALDDWHKVTNLRFIAHVFAADTGRGVWFQNEIFGVRSMSTSLGDVIDTLDEAQDYCEAVFMAASGIGDRVMCGAIQRVVETAKDTMQRGKDALQELLEPRQ